MFKRENIDITAMMGFWHCRSCWTCLQVVHRDLKLDNILLSELSGLGRSMFSKTCGELLIQIAPHDDVYLNLLQGVKVARKRLCCQTLGCTRC